MTLAQIQLPDPLYRRLKCIAEEQDWSLTEVIRRAGELYALRFPENRTKDEDWQLPEPVDLGEEMLDLRCLRIEADAIMERNSIE